LEICKYSSVQKVERVTKKLERFFKGCSKRSGKSRCRHLIALLKRKAEGYRPTKSKILTRSAQVLGRS
jgi:hypothetical protein